MVTCEDDKAKNENKHENDTAHTHARRYVVFNRKGKKVLSTFSYDEAVEKAIKLIRRGKMDYDRHDEHDNPYDPLFKEQFDMTRIKPGSGCIIMQDDDEAESNSQDLADKKNHSNSPMPSDNESLPVNRIDKMGEAIPVNPSEASFESMTAFVLEHQNSTMTQNHSDDTAVHDEHESSFPEDMACFSSNAKSDDEVSSISQSGLSQKPKNTEHEPEKDNEMTNQDDSHGTMIDTELDAKDYDMGGNAFDFPSEKAITSSKPNNSIDEKIDAQELSSCSSSADNGTSFPRDANGVGIKVNDLLYIDDGDDFSYSTTPVWLVTGIGANGAVFLHPDDEPDPYDNRVWFINNNGCAYDPYKIPSFRTYSPIKHVVVHDADDFASIVLEKDEAGYWKNSLEEITAEFEMSVRYYRRKEN